MKRSSRQHRGEHKTDRRGFNLVEGVVVLGVLAVLAALLAPAVQAAREASRRLQCESNLRQISVASHGFADVHRAFPTVQPAYWRLLPFTGDQPLLDAFERGDVSGKGSSLFLCASDGRGEIARGDYSYHMNDGTRFRTHARNGFVNWPRDRAVAELTDGLSHTAAYSERLITHAEDVLLSEAELLAQSPRHLWYTPRQVIGPALETQFTILCENERTSPSPAAWTWNNPALYAPAWGGYDHFLPPNRIGCLNGPGGNVAIDNSVVPASSWHSNGVNVLFADGHVSFMHRFIDRDVWRALGTIADADMTGAF